MSDSSRPFELRAGPGALRHLREHGLGRGDIGCIPAAAGGPKGLALLPLDRLLLRHGCLPPDRQDFHRCGADHAGRIRAWERAIAECARFAEAVLACMERPDPTLVAPI